MNKAELRKKVLALRDALTQAERAAMDSEIRKRLYSMSEWREAGRLLIYLSFGSEADTWEIVKKALSLKREVYAPRITDRKKREMDFFKISDLRALSPGAMGIMEPVGDERYTGGEAFMIMPGVAFSKELDRVGYGGGYYDKYLAGRSGIRRLALCYDCQLTGERADDTDARDIRPEAIVTESSVLR